MALHAPLNADCFISALHPPPSHLISHKPIATGINPFPTGILAQAGFVLRNLITVLRTIQNISEGSTL